MTHAWKNEAPYDHQKKPVDEQASTLVITKSSEILQAAVQATHQQPQRRGGLDEWSRQ